MYVCTWTSYHIKIRKMTPHSFCNLCNHHLALNWPSLHQVPPGIPTSTPAVMRPRCEVGNFPLRTDAAECRMPRNAGKCPRLEKWRFDINGNHGDKLVYVDSRNTCFVIGFYKFSQLNQKLSFLPMFPSILGRISLTAQDGGTEKTRQYSSIIVQ